MGRKEVRLTAQDSAVFGLDLGTGERLHDLIAMICGLEGDFMVRVGMMNPTALSRMTWLLAETYKHPKVFKFLHLPVQSGSDRVLGLMEREYTVDEYEKVLCDFSKELPGLCLSTDIIAGFPGETEDDFRASCELLKRVRPDVINIKAFSARPGTKARSMEGRVDTKVVKMRTKELTLLKRRICRENLSAHVGRDVRVLLTERPKPGTTMGRTAEYRPIAVKGVHPLGVFIDARVTGTGHSYLKGRRT